MKAGWIKVMSLALAALLLVGCRTLDPEALEQEITPASPETLLWTQLERIRPGDWQVPLNSGTDALDWRLRAIDTATDSIDLQTFLWIFDTTGALVLDHLVAAAERGVQVKILIDDSFLAGEEALLLALAAHPNIEYRVFNPFLRRSSNVVTRQVLNLAEFHRVDHRMHNKAMIIDNRIAIVGGRNIADEYFGLDATANFRDMELIIGGPAVTEVSSAFDNYWNDRWSRPIGEISHIQPSPADMEAARRVRDESVHVHMEETAQQRFDRWIALARSAFTGQVTLFVDEPPEANPAAPESAPVQVANDLIGLLENAREEVLLISAYLIPTPYLEGAIQRAEARGVAVRILTNSIQSNNHLTAHSAYRNHIGVLMDHGADLHEVRVDAKERHLYILQPIDTKALALHAKVLVVDNDKVFIGSANLDPRSLRINTEMGLLVTDRALNQAVRAAVAPDFSLANAWHLERGDDGEVIWISDDRMLESQPAGSFMQNVEDWFFAHLPIEAEL